MRDDDSLEHPDISNALIWGYPRRPKDYDEEDEEENEAEIEEIKWQRKIR